MTPAASRYVGIANGKYADLPALPRAVADTQALADLLASRHGFQTRVLADLSRGDLIDAAEESMAEGSAAGAVLILGWTGHAKLGPDGTLRLMGLNSKGQDVEVAQAGQLGEWAARTGARQALVIVDTCYSGGGMVDAVQRALAVDAGRRSPGAVWFGVIAASQADERSREGALAAALRQLLEHGPRQPDFRWDRTRPRIRGDDLIQALLADWPESLHQPHQAQSGPVWEDLVRNPLHVEGLRDRPLEHLLQAARGGTGEESFFVGREQALEQLVTWLSRSLPGAFILTGPPGCGKSAIVGRLVSLSASGERRKLLSAHSVPPSQDPGENSIDAQLQARGLNVEAASENLAGQFGLAEGLGVFGLLAHLRQCRQGGDPAVIVVDGLDEARETARDLAAELIIPLAREALVIVATRDLVLRDTTLLKLLEDATVTLDLGVHPESTLRDIRRYVHRRLEGISAEMDPERVADEVVELAGRASEASFLLARLITSQLRDHPIDTLEKGWQLSVSTTAENAFEHDLHSVVLVIDGKPQPTAVRELMGALAFAYGAGMPADDVWPAMATAASSLGLTYTRDHAYQVITALGRHIVASTEADQPVYRIAHQHLVDYLTAQAMRQARDPALRVLRLAWAQTLARLYENRLDAGLPPRQHPYLWRYAWRHLAMAGTPGIEALERLVARDRAAFLPDMASALELAGSRAWEQASPAESIALHERAVALRAELGEPVRRAMGLFNLGLARLSLGDVAGSDKATQEALEIARELRDQPHGKVTLTAVLLSRVLTHLNEGLVQSAHRLAEEVLTLAEQIAADADEESSRRLLAGAHAAAGAAAFGVGDLDSADRHGEQALGIWDEIGGPDSTEHRTARLETLGLLMAVRALRAYSAIADSQGPMTVAVDTKPGERILAELRQSRDRSALDDVLIGRGLAFLARVRFFNAVSGLSPDERPEDILTLVQQAQALVRPHAGRTVEAAVALASLAPMVRVCAGPTAGELYTASYEEAVQALRPFVARSPLANAEMGVLLLQHLDAQFQEAVAQGDTRPTHLIPLAQECVALLRPATSPMHRPLLAQALTQLSALLLGSPEKLDVAARAESIEVLRELAPGSTKFSMMLALQLSDQSGVLLTDRSAEAADLAREALTIAERLPSPPSDFIRAGAEINLAAALTALETPDGVAEMLTRALERLRSLPDVPAPWSWSVSSGMAAGYVTLAYIELNRAQPRAARDHAQQALTLIDAGADWPMRLVQRERAKVLRAQAECALGNVETGKAQLRETIEGLLTAQIEGRPEGDLLVYALNEAPEFWQEALTRLKDQPGWKDLYPLLRRWPLAEMDRTVANLVAAMNRTEGAALRTVRETARMHRGHAPDAFDAQWRKATGDVPAWLIVEPRHVQTVYAWCNCANFELSRSYIKAHPELLQHDTDVVLEELCLDPERKPMVDLHLAILADTRESGPDSAYTPLLLHEEIRSWLHSREPREHLARHESLLRPEVLETLRERAGNGMSKAAVFAAILELSARGERDLAFEALDGSDRLCDSLLTGWRGSDPVRQRALATILRHSTEDPARRATAAGAMLIARALETGDDAPDQALLAEVMAAPGGHERFTAAAAQAILALPSSALTLARLISNADAMHRGTSPSP